MATGLVAQINGAGSISYTPVTNAKVSIISTGTSSSYGTVSLNGVIIAAVIGTTSGTSNIETMLWVAEGQTITVAATTVTAAFITALES